MMKIFLSLLVTLFSIASNGQVIKANPNYKSFGGSAPTCPNILTLTSLTNWSYDVADSSYKPVSGNNGEGMAGFSISGSGYIQAYYSGADSSFNTAIFLTSTEVPAAPYYENVEFGVYVSASEEYVIAENGTYTGTSVAAVSGDLFRVWRTGTTVKAQYFRASTWTDLFTYTTSSTGSLFLGASSADPGWVVKVTRLKFCIE